MISAEEAEKIQQFRSILPPDLLTKERFEDDQYLIRWLRARHLNLEKASEMLKKSMKWREEMKADGILERGEEIPEKYRKLYPTGLLGRDRDDCVVLLLPLGRFQHREMMENEGMEKALRLNMIWMEKMMRLVKRAEEETGKKGLRLVEVVDMEYYSYKELTYGPARDFFLKANKMFDDNYPEMLKYMVVINAPKIFTLLFNLVKPVLSKETLSKISVYGSGQDEESWKEVIRSKMDPKRVPKRWGGVKEGTDEFCTEDPDVWLDAPISLPFFTQKEAMVDLTGFKCERVRARDKLEVELPLDSSKYRAGANIELHWKYKVDSYDIGFSIVFHPSKRGKDSSKGKGEAIIILPVSRTESKQGVQEGVHRCNSKNGLFTVIFDNGYSYTRSKTVYYCLELKKAAAATEAQENPIK